MYENLIIDQNSFKVNDGNQKSINNIILPCINDILTVFRYDNIYYSTGFDNYLKFIEGIQDVDIRRVFALFKSKLIEIIDLPNVNFGETGDIYVYDGKVYNGNAWSTVEVAYENDLTIISPLKNNEIIKCEITKNGQNKQIFQLSNIKHYYLFKSIYDENNINSFIKELGLFCHKKFQVINWKTLDINSKVKILLSLLKNHEKLKRFKFRELGRLGKSNRVEKLENLNIWEYKLAITSGTYRIYFKIEKYKIIVCAFRQKYTNNIDAKLRNILENFL